jgi:hypothetical protein
LVGVSRSREIGERPPSLSSPSLARGSPHAARERRVGGDVRLLVLVREFDPIELAQALEA